MTISKASGPEAIRQLERAANQAEPKIARAMREGIQSLQARFSQQEIADMLENQGAEAVVAMMDQDVTNDALQPLSAAIAAAAMTGGETAAQVQETVTGARGQRVDFVFNTANPRVSEFARTQGSERIREVGNDIRAVTRQVVRDGINRGDNPRTTARRIRESIGLTARQEQSVANYRAALENGDREALNRALRDKRFDRSVLAAIDRDRPLSQDQIDRMVERYRARYVKYRSEVVGRTESTRAVQGAQHELMESYVDEGKIAREQIRRFWHTAMDERVRSSHRQIPALNADGVGQNEEFQTPLGPLMYPGDPSGTAANVAMCRCAVFSRVVSMELIEAA